MTETSLGTKQMFLKIKIEPTVTIHMGKTKIGVITFDNVNDIKKFMCRLNKSIQQIIKEFENQKMLLKSHQETGTTISKSRLEEIRKGEQCVKENTK